MAISFPKYIRIKNNYCIGYFGSNDDILLSLIKLRPLIEENFSGLKMFISCCDSKSILFTNETNWFTQSEIKNNITEMAYFREITDANFHDFTKELNFTNLFG